MGTTTLDANLILHLTAMREAVLHTIFMELQKLYGALDHDRCLYILERYVVGPRILRLMRAYWDQIRVVLKYGVYFVPPFQGLLRGDPG